jgi:hypothetical protein
MLGLASHKTSHISALVGVVEETFHKSPSLFTGRQKLSPQIGLIFMSVDLTSPPFVIGHTFILGDKVLHILKCSPHILTRAEDSSLDSIVQFNQTQMTSKIQLGRSN